MTVTSQTLKQRLQDTTASNAVYARIELEQGSRVANAQMVEDETIRFGFIDALITIRKMDPHLHARRRYKKYLKAAKAAQS